MQQITQATMVIMTRQPPSVIDMLCEKDGATYGFYSQKTLADLMAEHPGSEVMSIDDAAEINDASYRTDPKQITEERYDEMLNILPPMDWRLGEEQSFKMSEMISGSITSIFVRLADGTHWEFQDSYTLPHHKIIERVRQHIAA